MGIEPTTSGLDLPLLCRLSYEVGQLRNKNNNRTHVANNKIYVAALQSLELPELDLATFCVLDACVQR